MRYRADLTMILLTSLRSSVTDLIRAAYAKDEQCVALLRALGSEEFKESDIEWSTRLRARLHRYSIDNVLRCYRTDIEDSPHIAVPHDEELKYRILYEAHDTALSGHLSREKTYSSVSQAYCGPNYTSE